MKGQCAYDGRTFHSQKVEKEKPFLNFRIVWVKFNGQN